MVEGKYNLNLPFSDYVFSDEIGISSGNCKPRKKFGTLQYFRSVGL